MFIFQRSCGHLISRRAALVTFWLAMSVFAPARGALLSANFDSGTNTDMPVGWTDVINYTTSSTTSTTTVRGAVVGPSNFGYPFVDHTTGSGNFAMFSANAETMTKPESPNE